MARRMPTLEAPAPTSEQPIIRTIGTADLGDALARGFSDFKTMPTHLAFLCVIYPVVTLIAAVSYSGRSLWPLVFPLLAGYTLIGPMVAVGLYELSRRRELGLDVSRRHAFAILRSPSVWTIAKLCFVLTVIYFAWMFTALFLYRENFNMAQPDSIDEFIDLILTTRAGWTLIIVGCGVGFLFAVAVFTLSVVSFPLLVDRNVRVGLAVRTSMRAVLTNPATMAFWGAIIAGSLLLGSLPLFIGLAVVLPVLGHASWHLYRKVVQF